MKYVYTRRVEYNELLLKKVINLQFSEVVIKLKMTNTIFSLHLTFQYNQILC